MEKLSFNEQIEQSIKDNWDLDALSDYKGETFQYKDIARIIEKFPPNAVLSCSQILSLIF